MIWVFPSNKFKIIIGVGIAIVTFVVGFIALAIDGLKRWINVNKAVKWLGYAFCLTAFIVSRLNEYWWNNLSNEKMDRSKLLDLKARGGFIPTINCALQILMQFHKKLKDKKSRKKTSFKQ